MLGLSEGTAQILHKIVLSLNRLLLVQARNYTHRHKPSGPTLQRQPFPAASDQLARKGPHFGPN